MFYFNCDDVEVVFYYDQIEDILFDLVWDVDVFIIDFQLGMVVNWLFYGLYWIENQSGLNVFVLFEILML